jgi:hypothetical protein
MAVFLCAELPNTPELCYNGQEGIDSMDDIQGLTPIPEYGDLMTLKEFISCCKSGGFINYDGTGYFATEEGYNRYERAIPSNIVKGIQIHKWATHVMWFNR